MKLFNRDKPRICEAVPFIYDYARRSKRSDAYKRTYRCIAKKLEDYEKSRGVRVCSNTFTDSVAEDFIVFMKDKNLMLNTVSSDFDKLSFMFRKMCKRNYEVDWSFEDVRPGTEDTVNVSITSEEIERIYHMPIRAKEREIVRDMFVANCLIGMRFGDFSKLTNDNIKNDFIFRKTKKTGEPVQVPIHRIVKEILDKYNGFPPYRKSQQNYNKIIKNICKQAGITDKVLWERTVGHKVVRKTYKRYELVSSHTARRSFATNAYLAGIPVARIMLITGHKTESSFFMYIKIAKSENAKELENHPFFQKLP